MSIGGLVGAGAGGVIGFFIGGPIGAFYGASLGFALGMAIDPLTPDIHSIGDPDQGDLVMSGEVGTPIADLAGTAKITGHLLCYGGERSKPIYGETSGGKGGEPDPVVTGHKYYMSWAVGIVAGEADKLYTVYKNDEAVWEGELDCPASGGEETITLDGMGSATFYFGTDDHALNSKVGALLDDPTLNTPYRHLCWCFLDDCYVGEYNRAPTMKFVVKKIPENAFSAKHEIQTYDCNPAHAKWFILHGLTGLPESWLHSTDFAAEALTLWGESRGLSILFDRQQSALSYLESINSHIDSILRYGTDGKFHPKLIRDDYVVGDLPLIDEDAMLDKPSFDRRSWIDTLNEMKVQYSEFYRVEADIADGDEWLQKAPRLNNEYIIKSLVVLDGKIYGGTKKVTAGGGALLEWNGTDIWVQVAPQLNSQHTINDMVVFNDKIYAVTSEGGRLFEWNGSDAWVQVAPQVEANVLSVVIFNSKLYGGTSFGRLLEWNGTDAWVQVAPHPPGGIEVIRHLLVLNSKLYGVAECTGKLWVWNGTDAWVEKAPKLSGQGLYGAVIYNNKIYAGTNGGWLLEWNDVDAWVQAAPHLSETIIESLYVFNSKLYGGTAYNGKLYVWNDVDAWEERAPKFAGESIIYSLVELSNQLYSGTYNSGNLLMWNSAYTPATAGQDFKNSISDPIAVDIGNYVTQGRIVSKTIQLASFTTNENAVWAAKRQLQKESYPFAFINIPVNRDLFRLQVGDCFKFSYSKYGISNMICRVLQAEEENLESEKIIIHAMEDVFGVSNAITEYSDPTGHAKAATSYDLTPFTHQKVVEAPYVFSSGIKIIPLACREEDLDLGFDVYLSIDGGDSYVSIGRISDLKPYGTLVGTYPADTYTIDEDTGFTIDFVKDVSLIETVTWASVFTAQVNNAILGNEVISFKTITPVAGTQYKLEDIIRGRFGTKKVTHVADEGFYFLGENINSAGHSEILAGVSRKFKLVPYNIRRTGDISEATAIDLSIEGESKKPYIPINFLANGSSKVARYSTDIALTWSPRYRGKGAGIGTPGTVLADTDREGYFEIEVWVSGSKVRTTNSIDAATWTYTEAMNNSDNGALASEALFKLLNYRTENGVLYESDQIEVTCKKK